MFVVLSLPEKETVPFTDFAEVEFEPTPVNAKGLELEPIVMVLVAVVVPTVVVMVNVPYVSTLSVFASDKASSKA